MKTTSPLTLDWFIHNTEIDNLEFIGDDSCLDKPINGVNVIDNPDGVPWIKKNELVLTTGYIFYKDIDLTRKLLRELHDIDCTALCIKVKRFYDVIPDYIQKEAARYRLALVAVPFYHSYSDIMRVVFRELELRHLSDKNFVVNETTRFCQLFSSNSDISSMLSMLSEYNDSIVMITDYSSSALYFHIPASLSRNPIIRPDSSSSSGSPSASSSDGFSSETGTDSCRYWINNQSIPFAVFPIPGGRYSLCIDTLSAPLAEDISAIIKNCLPVLSVKLESIQVNQRRMSSGNHFVPFFTMLSNMRARSSEEIKLVCKTFSFPYEWKRTCITFELHQSNQSEKLISQVYEQINSSMEKNNHPYFLGFYNNYVVLFLFFQKIISNLSAVNQTHMIAEYLLRDMDESMRASVWTGISRSHSRLATIGTAFEESLSAISMQPHLHSQSTVASYFRQLPYHLLKDLNHQELVKIYNDTIAGLVKYDKKNNTSLARTLRVYLENKLLIGETARQLFIHRNTLADHLSIIRRILGTEFGSMEEIFSFYLGLCAYDLLQEIQITPAFPESEDDS